MSKGKIIAGTLAGIICAGAIASGGVYGVKLLKDRDKTIDEQKTTIGQLEEENKVSKEKIEQLTKDLSAKVAELVEKDKQIEAKDAIIAEKDADIAEKQKAIEAKDKEIEEKNKTIADKDALISEKETEIEESNHRVQILNGQKTSLLSAVTVIDNKINSTSDAVEIDNLEARKTAILTQVDQLDSQIETLTSQKAQLENDVQTLQSDKTQLQSQVATLTSDKTNLQNQVNTLISEKTQLQQEVATLTTEKQNLQSQIDTLNTQLAEFEQYTLQINQTNPVESITIEDTKLGTSATMSNVNITTLNLYSWQNATIKYAPVDGSPVKATLNGISQETDTVTIVGNSNKGASISIGAIIETKSDVLNLSEKMFISKDNQWVVDFETKQVALYGGLMTIDTSTNKTVNIDGEDFNKYNLNTNLGGSTNYFVWVDNLDSPSKVYCGSSTSDDSDIPQDKSLFVQQTIKNPTVQSYYTDCKTQSFNFSDNTLTLNESGSAKLTGTFTQTDNILTVTWSDGSSAEITLIGTAVLIYNNQFFTLP